jgi:hypothetical protein
MSICAKDVVENKQLMISRRKRSRPYFIICNSVNIMSIIYGTVIKRDAEFVVGRSTVATFTPWF